MILFFTDFGPSGPYIGQMRSAITERAPNEIIIELLSNAPAFEPKASAYLLAALAPDFPDGSLFLCIIDPGVGGSRRPLIIKADNQIFIGPDNGLFSIIARRSSEVTAENITWRPDNLSASFHGRDLFAPIAAMIATGMDIETVPIANNSLAAQIGPKIFTSLFILTILVTLLPEFELNYYLTPPKSNVQEKGFPTLKYFLAWKRVQHSGTRMLTGLLKSPLIGGGPMTLVWLLASQYQF